MKSYIPLGTIINTIAVVIGSTIGLQVSSLFSVNTEMFVLQVIGLITLVLGLQMTLSELRMNTTLVTIFGLLIGAVLGSNLQIEHNIQLIIEKISQGDSTKFSHGLVTAFMLFCAGSMTLLGAFEEGLQNKKNILLIKSGLDGLSSIALAASLGVGVLFSAIPLLLYQSGLTLLARYFRPILIPIVDVIVSIGGIVLLALGFNLMGLTKIPVLDLMPSFIIGPSLFYFQKRFPYKMFG